MKSLFISLDVNFPVLHYKVINFLLWGAHLVPAGCAHRQYVLYMTILKSKKTLNFEQQLAPRFVIRYCELWLLSWSATLRVCKRIKKDGMKWYHDFFNYLESQQKAEEVCQIYYMQLRSGLKIEKKVCYFRKETTRRHSSTGKDKICISW